MEVEVSKPKSGSKSMMVKLIQEKSAWRLASLGGSEPQLKSIPRRRSSL
jgi:hypothetical protein